MVPVLPPNTLILASYRFGLLKPDDVVVFLHEGKEKIKRISEIRGGEMFVLGDHADASTDSRQFGWVYTSSVIAKVIYPRNLKPVKSD
jgi:hypothetical protein